MRWILVPKKYLAQLGGLDKRLLEDRGEDIHF